MSWVLGLITLFTWIFLYQNPSFARQIEYSTGPICDGDKVICQDQKSIPICLTLYPEIRIESIQPSCDTAGLPSCGRVGDVECLEFVNHSDDESLTCSKGKKPVHLGSFEVCDVDSSWKVTDASEKSYH